MACKRGREDYADVESEEDDLQLNLISVQPSRPAPARPQAQPPLLLAAGHLF